MDLSGPCAPPPGLYRRLSAAAGSVRRSAAGPALRHLLGLLGWREEVHVGCGVLGSRPAQSDQPEPEPAPHLHPQSKCSRHPHSPEGNCGTRLMAFADAGASPGCQRRPTPIPAGRTTPLRPHFLCQPRCGSPPRWGARGGGSRLSRQLHACPQLSASETTECGCSDSAAAARWPFRGCRGRTGWHPGSGVPATCTWTLSAPLTSSARRRRHEGPRTHRARRATDAGSLPGAAARQPHQAALSAGHSGHCLEMASEGCDTDAERRAPGRGIVLQARRAP